MSLEDEMPWRPDFPPETESFYDDIGWGFTAETDELDVLVGNFIYNFQGGPRHPKSQWLADGYVINDLVVVAPKAQRGRPMADNNFHRAAMNPANFYAYDELHVTRKDDAVVWRLGDIVYTCSPPTWHLGGRSGQASFDVHFRQQPSPVVWSYGTHEDAPTHGIGGGYCYVEGEGTITVGKQVLEIRNIAGVHERLCFSTGLDVIAQVGADTTGFGQGIAIHVLEGDVGVWALGSVDDLMFFLTVDGQHINYLPRHDGSVVTYTPLEPWHDRRSGLLMPTRWRVCCESAAGRLDLELAASGRGYYPWDMKRGYQLMYWFLCIANGSFTHPDGQRIPIENRRAQHEIVRNIIVHQETFDGPILNPDR
jgi:hypothetical protein